MTNPSQGEKNHPLTGIRRTGIVNSIDNPSDNFTTVGVFIGGDDTKEVQCSYLYSYIPVVGDNVLLLQNQGDFIVLGAIGFTEGQERPQARLIMAHKSTNTVISNATWTELIHYDVVEHGGSAVSGQISLDANGSLLIPEDGFYIIVAHAHIPGGQTCTRALVATYDAGLGSGGPPNNAPTWIGVYPNQNSTVQLSSAAVPRFYFGGTSVSAYYYVEISTSSVTVGNGGLSITGYQIA